MQARFPFLDEEVVETLLDMPLWDIVDLQQPIGHGDKKVLRAVCTSTRALYCHLPMLESCECILFSFGAPCITICLVIPDVNMVHLGALVIMQVAMTLGLTGAASLPKRAIQVNYGCFIK